MCFVDAQSQVKLFLTILKLKLKLGNIFDKEDKLQRKMRFY